MASGGGEATRLTVTFLDRESGTVRASVVFTTGAPIHANLKAEAAQRPALS
jgi:hypothetical protein